MTERTTWTVTGHPIMQDGSRGNRLRFAATTEKDFLKYAREWMEREVPDAVRFELEPTIVGKLPTVP